MLNEAAISRDLDNMWNVVAEAIQTILRREGYEKPYETLNLAMPFLVKLSQLLFCNF